MTEITIGVDVSKDIRANAELARRFGILVSIPGMTTWAGSVLALITVG